MYLEWPGNNCEYGKACVLKSPSGQKKKILCANVLENGMLGQFWSSIYIRRMSY